MSEENSERKEAGGREGWAEDESEASVMKLKSPQRKVGRELETLSILLRSSAWTENLLLPVKK